MLVIGGDHGMGGAPRLAAEAALRVGAGLVSLATRPGTWRRCCSPPEVMVHAVDDPSALQPLLRAAAVIAIGARSGPQCLGPCAVGCRVWFRAAAGGGMPMRCIFGRSTDAAK